MATVKAFGFDLKLNAPAPTKQGAHNGYHSGAAPEHGGQVRNAALAMGRKLAEDSKPPAPTKGGAHRGKGVSHSGAAPVDFDERRVAGLVRNAALKVGEDLRKHLDENVLRDMEKARIVDVISTPFRGEGAETASKLKEERQSADHFVFNPNTDLKRLARQHQMSEKEQGERWINLYTEVMKDFVRPTGGTCYFVCKGRAKNFEGSVQQGEHNIAEMSGLKIRYEVY